MEITRPKLIKKSEEGNKAIFEIEPLFPGYGITVGNALRRVLYSSLSGFSAVWVKINGVSHEFTTIPNIKEDVINIILNLKKLRFRLINTEKATIKLSVNSAKVVTGKDFEKNASIEIVNPEVEICTINRGGKLELELGIEKGIGYQSIEKAETDELPLGTIALDANYSPIELVNYKIDNTRVGQITNYEKVVLDIETDGTIDAEEAIKYAANIVLEQFSAIVNDEEEKAEKEEKTKKTSRKIPVEELGLPSRVTNALLSAKIKTVSNLLKLTEEKLSSVDGLGKKAIEEIQKKIKKYI